MARIVAQDSLALWKLCPGIFPEISKPWKITLVLEIPGSYMMWSSEILK